MGDRMDDRIGDRSPRSQRYRRCHSIGGAGTGIARARELHLFDAATGDRLVAERGPKLSRQVPKLLYVVGTLV
jgi:hypothetical protein